jgi:maltose 6'-phosphate phosphatase
MEEMAPEAIKSHLGGYRRKKCNSRDQNIVCWDISNRAEETKMKISRIALSMLSKTIVLILLIGPTAMSARAQAACPDVAGRRNLNIMTVNLLFSEINERQQRLARIADFAQQQAEENQPIDVILLQEVVSGVLVKTRSSSGDLQSLLAARGLAYNQVDKLVDGIPPLLWVGNAILSRCAIPLSTWWLLPIVTEEPFQGLKIPLPRVILMAQIAAPGAGRFNIYNTHFCAFCEPEQRWKQAQSALGFIRWIQTFTFRPRAVFGGDLNVDLNVNGFDIYSAIQGTGFMDSYYEYREAQSDACFTLSCCVSDTDPGCTYGVADDPYVGSFPVPAGPAARIDYVFLDDRLNVGPSRVVFRTTGEGFVSDHSAVLSRAEW